MASTWPSPPARARSSSSSRWGDAFVLGAATLLVPACFIAIFAAFAPQYLGMFRRLPL